MKDTVVSLDMTQVTNVCMTTFRDFVLGNILKCELFVVTVIQSYLCKMLFHTVLQCYHCELGALVQV